MVDGVDGCLEFTPQTWLDEMRVMRDGKIVFHKKRIHRRNERSLAVALILLPRLGSRGGSQVATGRLGKMFRIGPMAAFLSPRGSVLMSRSVCKDLHTWQLRRRNFQPNHAASVGFGYRRSLSAHATEESSFDTQRLVLDHIFAKDLRNYLFTTRKNIRDYEWSIDEADQLLDDIMSTDANNFLELGPITVMKDTSLTEEEQDSIGNTSQLYDVHDGQQRIVTLCLLFAAIRDNLAAWGATESCDKDRACEVAQEIVGRIYPQPTSLAPRPVCRVEVRSKNAKSTLRLILSKIDDGNAVKDLLGKESPLMPKKKWRDLPKPKRRILEVYDNYFKRVNNLGVKDTSKGVQDTLKLVKKMLSFVFMIVCTPSNTKIARNIVMGQSKGKNTEPVDIFKGLVCFNNISDDKDQDQILKEWNGLADDKKNKGYDGKAFFRENVVPAAKMLRQFYDSNIDLKKKRRDSSQSTKYCDDNDDDGRIQIEEKLRQLESISLWFILVKPRPPERFDRCKQIIGSEYSKGLDLLADERSAIVDSLEKTEFGATNADRTKAKAILERLSEHELLAEHQVQRIEQTDKSTLHLEHVLPQNHDNVSSWTEAWPTDRASQCLHILGNLALINQKKNAKIGNNPFEEKCNEFNVSPYPLTKRISKYDKWDEESVKKNHNELITLAKKVFALG
eukprot:scaffold7699_cov21-Cyclotella_meneghiniana.AAC.1